MIKSFLLTVFLFIGLIGYTQTGPLDATFVIGVKYSLFTALTDSTFQGYAIQKPDQFSFTWKVSDVVVGDIVIDQLGRMYEVTEINSVTTSAVNFKCHELQNSIGGPSSTGIITRANAYGLFPVVPQNSEGITPQIFARIINNNLKRQADINTLLLSSIINCDEQLITTFETDSTFVVNDSIANIGDIESKFRQVFVNGQLNANYTATDSLVTLHSYTLLPGDTVQTYFCLGGGFDENSIVFPVVDSVFQGTTLADTASLYDPTIGDVLINADTTMAFFNGSNWVIVPLGGSGGGGDNIYNASGSLTGNRTVTGDGNLLLFTDLSYFYVNDLSGNNEFFISPTGVAANNYSAGVTESSAFITGMNAHDRGYFQHYALSSPGGVGSGIENAADPTDSEVGFMVTSQPLQGTNANNINFTVGEFWTGTGLGTGLYLFNGDVATETWVGKTNYLSYETTTNELYVDGSIGINQTSPTSTLDINGSGGTQLRLRTTFTPSATADATGAIGDIAWDDDYVYVKTSAGWKRSALSTF